MRVHWFQHVPFEGLGSILPWLIQQGHSVHPHALFENAALPGLAEVDALIVMGGPMSVNDSTELPWLAAEKQFIGQMLAAGKPVLGICLGAQLIANALGAAVYGNPEKEIGWWPLQNKAESATVFQFPAHFDAFHWHGETFDLPKSTTLLASSAACQNQAFQLGDNVIGPQFHLETTPESATALVEHCAADLAAGQYVQNAELICNQTAAQYQQLNSLMSALLSYWLNQNLA